MSVLQYRDAINAPDVQVSNNDAFNNEKFKDSSAIQISWSNIKQVYVNRTSDSLLSDSSKENLSPVFVTSPAFLKSRETIKPLQPKEIICEENKEKEEEKKGRCQRKIEEEIKQIEKEISRLSRRLKRLRLYKDKHNAKQTQKHRRIVPAKFMDPPNQISKNLERENKVESSSASSLGPSEIIAGTRSRGKSCFWKLQDTEEEKVKKKSGKRLNLDQIKQKKLFKYSEKSVPAAGKKPMKTRRVVTSRYTQITNNHPNENSVTNDGKEEDRTRCDKRRASSVRKSCDNGADSYRSNGMDSRINKLWKIPSKEDDNSSLCISEMGVALPKIRTIRCVDESPRDSGPVKRVAELIGKRSYFCVDEKLEEQSACQELSSADGCEDEE